jgi:ubiquinone/menaquinone biosynthesis C-methylase UbiE
MTAEPPQDLGDKPGAVAGYYDHYWSRVSPPRYELGRSLGELLERNVTPATSCLDVGCGAGRSYATWLNEHACSYVGVDVSSKAVELAQEVGLDARMIGDATDLPFADASFDLVICIEVLEHLFSPDGAAREMHRVLRPKGVLIASAPNAVYWRLRANLLFGVWNPLGDELSAEQPWRDPHVRFFSPRTLERMLRHAGFAQVTVGTHGGRFLDHLTPRPTAFGEGRIYRTAERWFPSLLGLTIHSVAVK